MNHELLSRITTNPDIMTGKPTIRGTRLTVEHLAAAMDFLTFEELRADYPFLEREDLEAVREWVKQNNPCQP